MERIRIQTKENKIEIRVNDGEFTINDLSARAVRKVPYSGPDFSKAWAAVTAIVGEQSVPSSLKKYVKGE